VFNGGSTNFGSTSSIAAQTFNVYGRFDDHDHHQRGVDLRSVGDRCADLRRSCGALPAGDGLVSAIGTASSLAVVCQTALCSYYHGERGSRRSQFEAAA
jgi:hypothetical protein